MGSDERVNTFAQSSSRCVELLEELLDAHLDTVQLGLDLDRDADWLAHIGYLRRLWREGQECLTELTEASKLA